MDPGREVKGDPRRELPAVDRLARQVQGERPALPGWAATEGARRALRRERERLASHEEAPTGAGLVQQAREEAESLALPRPRRVVNATGIALHTNLGRAPLAPGAAEAVARVAQGYADLELDLRTGRRGDRQGPVAAKLSLLAGSAAAMVVNNNAAAVMLALDTLARGRQVIVSRGELVEIGGSFRVPDIMARAGVELVEVGTTNRTHLGDYEAAIGPDTALLLKVHRSNFSQTGFVAEVSLSALAELGRAHGLPVLEDLGSGTLIDLSERGFPAEVFAPARLRSGADLVCFSGDKLLGGPQAGIILGAADPVAAMRRNPLARALRLDKLSLAALDWTLAALLDGRGETEIPVLRQLLETAPRLEARAARLAECLVKRLGEAASVGVEADRSGVGGGSLPGFELPTWVVTLRARRPGLSPDALAARLRAAAVPVLTRVRDDAVVIDLRSLLPDEDPLVENAVSEAFGAAGV